MENKVSFSPGFFGQTYNSINKKVKYNNPNYSIYNNKGKSVNLEPLVSRVGWRPILLNEQMEQIEILENATDVILEQEVKGMDELTFKLNLSDKHREKISNEKFVQMFDTVYIIRNIIDNKSTRETEVFCEATWYDLMYTEPFSPEQLEWTSTSVKTIMSDMLKGTGWSVGKCEVDKKVTVKLSDVGVSKLSGLRQLEEACAGELVFETMTKKINMVADGGTFTGASIMYNKNADNIKAEYDTRELVTKLIPYGKNGMTIADANNGKIYLENYSYTNAVRYQAISDERYTNPYELKAICEVALAELCKPRVSYTTTMSEITTNTSGHEKFYIGGIVRVYDTELNLDAQTRIMKWKLNVSEPWNSDVVLESKAKSLSELLTGTNNSVNSFSQDETISTVSDLSVYNYLLNSRADYGMNYWQNTGWSVDVSKGGTGKASFLVEAEVGKTKTLAQKVYPSSRSAYSLSFKANSRDVEIGSGTIGVEIEIEFEDGTTEKKYIKLA